MKKSILLVFLALYTFNHAQSLDIKIDKVNYELEGGKAFILGFDEKATKVTIQDAITYKKQTYKVAGVKLDSKGNTYYDGNNCAIREIVFAEGVTEVFDKMAMNMTKLDKVVLPSTLSNIGQSAFSGCAALADINIPDSVRTIGGEAFRGCSSLTEVTIPKTIRRIGAGLFYGCSSLAKITIQMPVNGIPDYFFRDCKSLDTIVWRPLYIKSIGTEAFRGCKTLKSMKVPSNVKTIGVNAFFDCSSLKAIRLPDGLTKLTAGALAKCTSLMKVSLPAKVKSIGRTAFEGCSSLTSITMPDSMTAIGNEAFKGCTSLKKVVIPSMVNEFGDGVFSGCSSLSSVIIQSEIKEIPEKFFSKCKSLETIVIPNSVRFVGVEAFGNCSSLTNVVLPDSAKYLTNADAAELKKSGLSHGSFYRCEQLTNIKCHNGGVPSDILTYIPTICQFALNGGKSDNPDFDKPQAGSVTDSGVTDGGTAKFIRRNAKYVFKSDVDMSIPVTKMSNDSTFAIIIGNENYKLVPHVKYAENDAVKFAEYCMYTLGLPEKNITMLYDASYDEMPQAIRKVKSDSCANAGKFNVIFYYSGHGVPNGSSHDAFLLSIDADGSTTEKCYAVSQLYRDLTDLKARRTLVFLDACFSGARRDGGVLQESARGVAIRPRDVTPMENMVVFSAATGDETAFPFEGNGHGMFTYFLLKKMKETRGDVTLGELAAYIKTNVGKTSVLENKKSQTPTISTSHSIANTWADMELR